MQNFPTHRKIDFFRLFLYFLFGAAALFLYFVGNNGEPFSLALTYALLSAKFPPIVCACLHVLPSFLSGDVIIIFLYIGQSLLLLGGFFLQKKFILNPFIKTGVLSFLALTIGLAMFVAFAPFQPYLTFFDISIDVTKSTPQKILFAAVIFLLSATFSVAIKALLRKLLKCRLRNDEILFSVLLLCLVGIGMCHFLSVNAYMGVAFFILLLFACLTKDASTLLCAFLLSLPPMLTIRLSPDRFFVYGVVITIFIKSGRFAAACAALLVFFAYGYFDGLYSYETPKFVQSLLSIILPILLFVTLPNPLIRSMENKLVFYREKHLSRIAINRNRAAIGEKLFEISSVFKEIQTTFSRTLVLFHILH